METVDVLSGLLTQKPGRDPEPGQIKCYLVEKRTSANGTDWLKVKNSTPDKGGSNYRIVAVQPTDFTDAHGNISFSIQLEPAQTVAPMTPQSMPMLAAASQTPAPDSTETCKQHLERAGQAMVMVMKEAIKVATEWEAIAKSPLPPEHLQALCASLFINLDRSGMIDQLPLQKPF